MIPATHEHSSESPESRKQPNTWDLKDPSHPLYQHRMQRSHKKWLDQARGHDSYKCPTSSPEISLRSPELEDIPKDEGPRHFPSSTALSEDLCHSLTFATASPEEHLPIAGPSAMPEELDSMDP
jgi:hypothetical protein